MEPHVRAVLLAEQERLQRLEGSLIRCLEIGRDQLVEREGQLAEVRRYLQTIEFGLSKPVREAVPA